MLLQHSTNKLDISGQYNLMGVSENPFICGIVSRAEMLKEFRYHKKMGNTLVCNLVERFIEKVLEERKLHSSESIEIDQHVFIYTDIVKPQIVGPMTSRLLTMLHYPGVFRRDVFHHENFSSIEF